MASRGVRPQPRGKPSGLPFHAHFTDVAARAGLRAPVIYGPPDRMDYILESMGCGVAFLDYDNDGWLDIFLLSGTRREGPVKGATNRLYKNNRDGTFTDVTAKAGLVRQGWAMRRDCRRLQQRRFRGSLYHRLAAEHPVPQQRRWHFHRRDGDRRACCIPASAGALVARGWTTIATATWICSFPTTWFSTSTKSQPTGKDPNCNFKGVPVNCGPRGLPAGAPDALSQQWRRDFHGCHCAARASAAVPPVFGLTAVAADLDGDGWQEIYVACDSTPSLLFHNRGDGTFEEQGLQCGPGRE